MNQIRLVLGFACAFAVCGCSSTAPPADTAPSDPDRAIDRLQVEYMEALEDRRFESPRVAKNRRLPSRALIRKKAENVSFRHPNHAPARVINGVLAYELDDSERATQHLDHALRVDGTNPEAAVLRARIALEDGNVPYAIRMLREQVSLRPGHAGLREVQASAFFMARDHASAREALNAAEQLGAPNWRVSYNRGLVEEDAGNTAEAMGHYHQAVAQSPGTSPAQERLKGLERVGGMAAPTASLGDPSGLPEPMYVPDTSAASTLPLLSPSIPASIASPSYGNSPR